MNVFICAGNVTGEPIIRTVGQNQVANFGIAVRRPFKNRKTGQYGNDFFNVQAWNQEAQYVQRYIHTGMGIIIQGNLRNNQYTNRSGQQVRSCEVQAREINIQHNNPRNKAYQPGNQPNSQNSFNRPPRSNSFNRPPRQNNQPLNPFSHQQFKGNPAKQPQAPMNSGAPANDNAGQPSTPKQGSVPKNAQPNKPVQKPNYRKQDTHTNPMDTKSKRIHLKDSDLPF